MRIHTSLTIAALTLFATAIFGRPSVHLDERPQFPDIDRVVLRAVEYAPPAGTGDHCLNAPNVLAGTFYSPSPHRGLSPSSPRTATRDPRPPVLSTLHTRVVADPNGPWCIPFSGAYMRYFKTATIAKPILAALLHETYGVVQDIIFHLGDGYIEPNGFSWRTENGLMLSTWNAGAQRTTWGQLLAAINAMYQRMELKGYELVDFAIYNGEEQVGWGTIERT